MPDSRFVPGPTRLICGLAALAIGVAAAAAAERAPTGVRGVPAASAARPGGLPFLDGELNRVWSEWHRNTAALPATERAARSAGARALVSFVFADERSAEKALALLSGMGAEVTAHSRRLVDARVPVASLVDLSGLPGLMLAHRPLAPVGAPVAASGSAASGPVTAEGVAPSGAGAWHTAGIDGTGVTVGIIGSFAGYGLAVTAGELPDAFAAGELDVSARDGSASAEVVHDMAPGAALLLASAATTTEAAAAIDALAALGAKVISSSVQYVTPDEPPFSGPGREPPDGSSTLCQAISAARADHGALFVQAAGDLADSHWDGTFTDTNRDLYHEFAPGVEINEIALGTTSVAAVLRWDDWPASSQDYDLELWMKSAAGIWQLEAASQNEQSGTQPPWEYIQRTLDPAAQYGLRVKKYGATRNVFLDLIDFSRAPLALSVPARSVLDIAACADAFSVASIDVQSPELPLEATSSQGPTYGPGGVPTGGSDQPRIAGYANVDTFSFGENAFTSSPAAASHVTGAAALVLSREPLMSPAQVQGFLEARAIDVPGTPPGYDHQAGAGRLALGSAALCAQALTPSSVEVTIDGSEGSFEVASDPGCPWEAVSGAEWLTVVSGSSGSGNGTVGYAVAANGGDARSAAVSVGTAAFTVSQAAASCTFELSAAGVAIGAEGGAASVGVSTNLSSCEWTAAANDAWIVVTAGEAGTGSGTVELAVEANEGEARTGTVTVAGMTFTVEQAAAPCSYGLSEPVVAMPAAGGEASVGVTTTLASCEWTAVAGDAWITVTDGASGTGSGVVSFSVAANEGEARTGTITVAGAVLTVEQDAAPCAFQLGASSFAVTDVGGETDVTVTTNLASCQWTAAALDPWIAVASGAEGAGIGTVHLVIAANPGEARTGTVAIAGLSFTIEQAAAPCAFVPSAAGAHYPAAGGTGSVSITANRETCAWTAVSNAEWITVTAGATTTGSGTVSYTVAANTGEARLGTLTVAGHTYTVEQDAVPCELMLGAQSQAFTATGGSGSVGVVANLPTCQWSALADVEWVTITGIAAGTGSGAVTFSVAANPGVARTGTLTIAGASFTVLQGAAGCTYSLFSWSSTWGPEGGTGGQTRVYASQTSCTWNAFSNVSWVTITGGSSGTGNEVVTFDVAANPGQARQGTVTVAGWTYRVYQDGVPCAYTISPEGAEATAAGGGGTVTVTASHPSCTWTAVSTAPEWLTVTAGAQGAGSGTVSYAVAANPGDVRIATLVIGGRTFTVQQASPPCTYGVAPTAHSFPGAGGEGGVAVTTNFGSCPWTAVSNAAWITVTSGASGAGTGAVAFAVADNPGGPREGTLTVAAGTVTVTQDEHGTAVRRSLKGRS